MEYTTGMHRQTSTLCRWLVGARLWLFSFFCAKRESERLLPFGKLREKWLGAKRRRGARKRRRGNDGNVSIHHRHGRLLLSRGAPFPNGGNDTRRGRVETNAHHPPI